MTFKLPAWNCVACCNFHQHNRQVAPASHMSQIGSHMLSTPITHQINLILTSSDVVTLYVFLQIAFCGGHPHPLTTPTQALPPYDSRVRSHELSLAREFDNLRVSVDLEPQCPKPSAADSLRPALPCVIAHLAGRWNARPYLGWDWNARPYLGWHWNAWPYLGWR